MERDRKFDLYVYAKRIGKISPSSDNTTTVPMLPGVECEQTRKQELLYKLAFHKHKIRKVPHTSHNVCVCVLLWQRSEVVAERKVFTSRILCEICYLIVQLET